MKPIGFYQQHLDRVSRSFAFCIARLEGEMRLWVSLSYLLCRLLDTVEDAPWTDDSAKQNAFRNFQGFLHSPAAAEDYAAWARLFPANLPEGERLLLADAASFFDDFHSLSANVTTKIRRSVLNMSRGMQYFSAAQGIRLRNLAEVNQYCFFVAGLVGELLSDLLLERLPSFSDQTALYLEGHHFGLFLQKVNLLKDQREDEQANRFLVPSRPELLASLAENAQGAIAYLQRIPVSEKGYRLFCAWSLFLGLSSLPWIQRGWKLGILGKLPRLFTEKLLVQVEKVIDDNGALLRLFQDILPALPKISLAHGRASLEWFAQVYDGALSQEHLAQLGMLPG